MTEIVVTSSALILALLALRRLFRQKISRRVQYALWALVLVRLLVPVSLPAAECCRSWMGLPCTLSPCRSGQGPWKGTPAGG